MPPITAVFPIRLTQWFSKTRCDARCPSLYDLWKNPSVDLRNNRRPPLFRNAQHILHARGHFKKVLRSNWGFGDLKRFLSVKIVKMIWEEETSPRWGCFLRPSAPLPQRLGSLTRDLGPQVSSSFLGAHFVGCLKKIAYIRPLTVGGRRLSSFNWGNETKEVQ